MFDIGMPEMIMIFIVALLVVGPKKLPEIAKALGKGLGELKKSFQDVKDTVQEEFEESTSEIRDAVTDVKRQIQAEVEDSGKEIQKTMETVKEQIAQETGDLNEAIDESQDKAEKDAGTGPVVK
ncbi:MAG: Sec-independent protein translocase protein TatB [Thermodesulfovibrionales bacterium]